jgi:hypothetical protein
VLEEVVEFLLLEVEVQVLEDIENLLTDYNSRNRIIQ